jgi:hypothetical protein
LLFVDSHDDTVVVVVVVVVDDDDDTQILTPINTSAAPTATCHGRSMGSPNHQLVTNENTSANALQMGTARLKSDDANKL